MQFRNAFDPFRAWGGALALVRRAPLTLITGSLVLVMLDPWGGFGVEGRWNEGLGLALNCFPCALGVAFLLLRALFLPGFATAVERVAVKGEERIGDLFRARGRFPRMLLGLLVYHGLLLATLLPFAGFALALGFLVGELGSEEAGVVVGVLAFLVLLPVLIYLVLGILLMPFAMAFERLSPFEALARSWSLVRGNRLWLFWFFLAQTLLLFLTLCCCCCLSLPVGGLSCLATFEAYLRLVRDDQALWACEGGAGAPLRTLAPDDPDPVAW
jgi:hypothetical protein